MYIKCYIFFAYNLLFLKFNVTCLLQNSMLGLSFGTPMLISHNANRRGNRNRGRRHGKVSSIKAFYHLSDSKDFKFVNEKYVTKKIKFVVNVLNSGFTIIP